MEGILVKEVHNEYGITRGYFDVNLTEEDKERNKQNFIKVCNEIAQSMVDNL